MNNCDYIRIHPIIEDDGEHFTIKELRAGYMHGTSSEEDSIALVLDPRLAKAFGTLDRPKTFESLEAARTFIRSHFPEYEP